MQNYQEVVEVAGLCLAAYHVPLTQTPMAPARVNHLWVVDRSGSMTGTINQLCDNLWARARTVSLGDTITLAWFSGEGGQNEIVFQGFKVTEDADYTVLEQAINRLRGTIGLTCFSEVLAKIEQALPSLALYSPDFSFLFLTDGNPVVSRVAQEMAATFASCERLGGVVKQSLVVGYSYYYDRGNLSRMAASLGGSFVHASDIQDFGRVFEDFVTQSGQMAPKLEVVLPGYEEVGGLTPFSLSGGQIVQHQVVGGTGTSQAISYAPLLKEPNVVFYPISASVPDGEWLTPAALVKKYRAAPGVNLLGGAYAVALLFNQNGATDQALAVLSALGDKGLTRQLANAFTNDEAGRAEEAIREAVFLSDVISDSRFREGYEPGCLPPDDAFCLLDAVDALMADSESKFFPYHPRFVYQHTTVAAKAQGGYPKFTPERSVGVNFQTLSWHKERLNLSVLAALPGTIPVPPEGAAYGLGETLDTHIFRNYTLVKGGNCHIQVLPVTCQNSTLSILQRAGLVVGEETFNGATVYFLDLLRVPVMNRAMGHLLADATRLGQQAVRELELTAALKVYKEYATRLEEATGLKVRGSRFSPETEAYVATLGIRADGSFSPPVDKQPATDYYLARAFKLSLKGCSSLPKVSEAAEKAAQGKKLNIPGQMMAQVIKQAEQYFAQVSEAEAAKWLKSALSATKLELQGVRKGLQRAKFAVGLGGGWFAGFSRTEDTTLTFPTSYGEIPATFSRTQVKVEF